ncbi:hypothetical protein LQ318_07560 [Aliifodinibius salicampi]|uniref:Lipoprotein n=1 Tax=Fodinibius salicampi TaxID=1920655 RepID=A0ABT3PY36_9BACT|nr:hypothetical protein [Fodinibius salicampi]MCW9712757.1 hypothetical protein [Fodinibius salicampi]
MIKRLLLLSTISCLLLISCSDDPSSFTDEPPELPPAASIDIDMSTLTESPQSKSSITTDDTDYFVQAVFRAGFMKKIIEAHLLIPKNLLEAAEDTVAQLNEEQQWEWSYQYSSNTNGFDVRLIAERISSSAVNWSFLVTADHLNLEEHLVFGGTTQNMGAQGVWTYYGLKDSEDDQKLSEIDWDIQGDSTQIRLEVLSDLSVASGSYIDYDFDGVFKTIEFYNAEADETTIIQWNVDTKAGYIIAPDVNNGEKACWDEDQENVPCSE